MKFRFLDEVLYADAVSAKLLVVHLSDEGHVQQGSTGGSVRRHFMIDAGGEVHHVFESTDEQDVFKSADEQEVLMSRKFWLGQGPAP